jgi:hypothetical protein
MNHFEYSQWIKPLQLIVNTRAAVMARPMFEVKL